MNGCKYVSNNIFLGWLALTLKHQRRIGTDQHGTSTHATHRPSTSLLVNGNVAAHDNGIPSVPAFRLNPVDSVEKGGGRSVASVLGVDTLNVGVTRLGEEVHKKSFGRLGLVDEGLGTNVQATDGPGVDIVLFKKRRNDCKMLVLFHQCLHFGLTGQSDGVDVLSVALSAILTIAIT